MHTLSDIQLKILKEEFPAMSIDSDSDIERYFELRKIGRQADALSLYNNRLKKKYPAGQLRERLLSYYRSRDPRYILLLHDSLVMLAERLVSRTTYIIDLLTKDIDSIDLTDAYSVIKLAEGLLSIISPDRYQAIAFTEKYTRLAKLLDHRMDAMEKTSELIRLYVTDDIESVQDLKREKEESRKRRARQQDQYSKSAPGFDLSKIVFSADDISKIVVPASITKTEDIVIAYCMKYWNFAFDAAFEKTIILYSRKFHTRHSDIYQAIRNGREHDWKDEEILNAVLATVVSGYYYSISGDLYLQHTWAKYKATLQNPLPAQIALPAPVSTPAKASRTARKTILKAKSAKKAKQTIAKSTTRVSAKKITPFKPTKQLGSKKAPELPAFSPNSIADIIKNKTGKTYTVYKELFFRSIRPSIRNIMTASKSGRSNLFGGRQNDAEEAIYKFLFEHYNDPYQNWQKSDEKKTVEKLGFNIPEIEPIIVRWIHNSER